MRWFGLLWAVGCVCMAGFAGETAPEGSAPAKPPEGASAIVLLGTCNPVPDPDRSCLGMEYFCFKGDGLWTAPDDELIALATR